MNKITSFSINKNNKEYKINVGYSKHAYSRKNERCNSINDYVVASNIMALGTGILSRTGKDVAVIDNVNNFTVIFAVEWSRKRDVVDCEIITIINKSNVFVKSKTDIVNVSDLF